MVRSLIVAVLFSFAFTGLYSQRPDTIRVKRNNRSLYFFQSGVKRDTVTRKAGNVFYLLVPDSLKEFVSVQSENGQLAPLPNDSLVQLNFLKGLKYELIYAADPENQVNRRLLKRKTRINGAVSEPHDLIIIKIVDKRENSVLMENRFFFKD